MPLKVTVLGSGTSMGVPTIGCDCDVCTSPDPRDNRLRPSVLFSVDGKNILVDTTPDFRFQALRAKIKRVDAILFTHEHADHIMGLDDVRPFNFHQRDGIPIYAAPSAMTAIRRAFHYIFDGQRNESNVPRISCHELDGRPFELFGREVQPVPVLHGSYPIYGFRIGRAAYLTDHSEVPEASLPLLAGLDVLFLDALRYKPHPTHSTVERSLRTARAVGARRVFFTHICHELPHARTEERLPPDVRLAYDTLEIDVEDCI